MSLPARIELMIFKIRNNLPCINSQVKDLLCDIYRQQMGIIDEEQREQAECLTNLFDQLIDHMNLHLHAQGQSIHDQQISAICDQTKKEMKIWKEKWLQSSFDIEEFDKAFVELVKVIDSVFIIMSTIFRYVTSKGDTLEDKIHKIGCENDLIKSRIERMEKNELKRIQKEKCHERRILIRDLFLTARRRLLQQAKKRKLPQNTLSIIYGNDITQLSNQYPLILELLRDISAEFQINEEQLLMYLQEKKQSNKEFHLDKEIKMYATSHQTTKDYDVNDFLELQGMHCLDSDDFGIFQPVFRSVCFIINHGSVSI